ncbi:MAG TPA: glycosyltransferase, partial [Actinomycetota bacterium]|nr:glycosyltransferase [Actinomycetota bacterium]
MTKVPDEVRALAAERDERRRARDFAAADALRDRIARLGFSVTDGPDGPSLEPLALTEPHRSAAHDVESLLDEPATADASVHWVVEGWPEDVARGLAGFRANEGGRDVRYVVADVTETEPSSYGADVEVLALETGTGWSAALNAGLKRSRGRSVLVMDGSIEPTGDVFAPLEAALEDPSVGVCGPFGISTEDLREFHESDGPEVDAIEGYLMAFRRDVIRDVGLFDEKFRWYRTA